MKKILIALCLLLTFNGSVLAKETLKGRTISDFQYSGDVFKIAKKWAEDENYHIRKDKPNEIKYKKGYGIWYAPIFCEISKNGNNIHMESWVSPNILTRAMSLFLIFPKEMQLHSKGFRGKVPRQIGRNSVNELLVELNQETIK